MHNDVTASNIHLHSACDNCLNAVKAAADGGVKNQWSKCDKAADTLSH